MTGPDDDEVGHTVEPGRLDSHQPIILAGQKELIVYPLCNAGNDTDRIPGWFESVGKTVVAGSESVRGGAQQFHPPDVTEAVNDRRPLVRGSHEDDAPEILRSAILQVGADQESSERMSDIMHSPGILRTTVVDLRADLIENLLR